MSTVESDTTSGPAHSNSGGRKREACDRCHGQKLRCIFHSQSQDSSESRCVRCAKAGASCTTSISGRAGRPRIFHSPFLRDQTGRGRGNKRIQRDRIVSRLAFNVDGNRARVDSNVDGWQKKLEGSTLDRESSGNAEGMVPVHATSSLPVHDTLDVLRRTNFHLPASLWSDESLPAFFNDNTEETLDFLPSGLEYSWASHEFQAQPAEIQPLTTSPPRDGSQIRDASVGAHITPAQRYSSDTHVAGASEEAIDIDMSNGATRRAPINSTKVRPPRAPDQNREDGTFSFSPVVDSTADPAPFMNIAQDKTTTNFNDESLREIQYRRMQKLSEFAMDLYEQGLSISSDNHQPLSTAMATALRDQLVGSVLKSSITFSKLLDSYCISASSSTPSSSSSSANYTTSINRSNLNSSPSDSGTSTSAPALSSEAFATNELMHHPHGNLFTSSSDDSKQPPPVDITIILQLVICYIRIIHLHSVMYRRILDYLIAFPLHPAQQILPVFPGMQVGGVSLDSFGMFQIKLLVQISVHVLGGIEIALGLPEWHRVGGRKDGGSRILESNLSGRFVECLMREKAWRTQNVECVKKNLRDLREVLEGALEM